MCFTHLCHVYLVQIVVKTVAAHGCVAFPPMYAMCAWEGFLRTGGDDTAMCWKNIHRLGSQEEGVQQSNLTSYITFFCTCVKFLESRHPILIEHLFHYPCYSVVLKTKDLISPEIIKPSYVETEGRCWGVES